MRQTRRFHVSNFFMVFALAAVMLFTACGGGDSQATTSGPVTIKLWIQSSRNTQVLRNQIDGFNKSNKDVQIKLVAQGSDTYTQTLTLAFQSHQAPDVFLVAGLNPQLLQKQWGLALNKYVSQDTLAAYKPYLTEGQDVHKGQIYSIPTEAQTSRLVYNRDLFRAAGLDPNKPPTTFSEVEADAQKITEASKGAAYGFGLPLKWAGIAEWQVDPLVLASDNTLTKEGLFNTTTGQFDSTKYQSVVELYRNMVKNKWVFPGASSLDADPLRSAFAQGKIGMYIGASFDVKVINVQFKSKADWAAAPLPVQDGQQLLQSPSLNGLSYAISAYSQHPKEAGKVLEFMVGLQMMQKLEQAGQVNALLPGARAAAFLPKHIKGFQSFIPGKLDIPYSKGPNPLMKIQGKTYVEVINELILSDEQIQPALGDLAQRYQTIYKQGVASGSIDPTLYVKSS
ncbi:MAG: extracellular solute-binding protein [Ktedonobacteraceae bacterium]